MRRRGRRPIEAPHSAAPNRSGDGAPAPPHGRSNEGHWWTSRDTLSESEVEDLLAYLKTL